MKGAGTVVGLWRTGGDGVVARVAQRLDLVPPREPRLGPAVHHEHQRLVGAARLCDPHADAVGVDIAQADAVRDGRVGERRVLLRGHRDLLPQPGRGKGGRWAGRSGGAGGAARVGRREAGEGRLKISQSQDFHC